jgi:elongation factor 1-gamma
MYNGLVLTGHPSQIDIFSRERLLASLDVLEKVLLTRTYLVGHRLTLADITLATVLQKLFQTLLGVAERAKIPNTVRHFDTVVNQTVLKPVFGTTAFVEKAQQYVAPAKPAKEKAPAAAPAPPKAKPAPKPAPAPAAQEDEEDEPSAPEEPKAKNPLDLLPKSTLNLEDWKRAYSNLDTRGPGGSLEWFYEK